MACVLVTGGAGFIGSHLVDRLVADGHCVRVLDSLEPQVHGGANEPPPYVNARAEFIRGDVRRAEDVRQALTGIDVVFHEAAAVGVGQSMHEIRKYVETNSLGAATLLEAIVARKSRIIKVIVASSMSVYGEGEYECRECGPSYPQLRSAEQLMRCRWEMQCLRCHQALTPVPTAERKPLMPASVYAVTKRDHEELFLTVGRAYAIPTVALRYFNVYGKRQALSNPYTGLIAILASCMLNGRSPIIFEDGLQTRDFTHVSDIVQANILALKSPLANYEMFNVGTGRPLSVLQVADALASRLGFDGPITAGTSFRAGDIRHCYADVSKIGRLGYTPQVAFEDGIQGVVEWVRGQPAHDHVEQAYRELVDRTLTT